VAHRFGDEPTTVARATAEATRLKQESRPGLHDALHAVAGAKDEAINPSKLGRYLKRNARRIEDGLRIENVGEDPSSHCRKFRIAGASRSFGDSHIQREENGNEKIMGMDEETTGSSRSPGATICRRCGGEGCEWCQGAA